jgi:glycyl-tRNA synthetase
MLAVCMDEAGTPYCICLDYQTKDDGTVTIRDRDSMQQVRVHMGEVAAWVDERISPN